MTHVITPTPLTWGWISLSILMLAFQTALMLATAPFFSGWVDRLGGRLTGQNRYRASGRWQEIRHQFVRPGYFVAGDRLSSLGCRSGFVLSVLAAGMVPVFALLPAGFPAPGLLLVCAVLVGASLLLCLPLLVQRRHMVQNAYMALMAESLLLPALVPVLVMVGGQDLSAFLAHVRSLSPLGSGAPFVLMGVALFAAAAWRGRQAGETLVCPLSGADRGLWLLATDIVLLCWVTLAGDVAWAGCLALPSSDGTVETWLMECLQGGSAWLLKLVVAASLLAVTQLMVLPLPRRARVRLASVFLLGLLAWQAAYPSLAPAVVQDKTASIQVQDPALGEEGTPQ